MTRLFVLLFLFLASVASAQTPTTTLGPADAIRVGWPAPTVATDGLNAPDGFRIKATSTATGTVLKTWEAAATDRTLLLGAPTLPAGAFTLAVHAFNVAGEAGASNVLGPFGLAAIPEVLAGATATVERAPVP